MNISYPNDQTTVREQRIEMLVVGFIAAAILEAEAATSLVAPLIGLVLYGVVMLTTINIYLLIPFLPHRKTLLALLLLPIIRLVSLTVPIAQLPQLYWYAAIGVPMLVSTALVSRVINPPISPLQVQWHNIWMQVAFGLTGIPLGVIVYQLFPQKAIVSPGNWIELGIGFISLVIFSAFIDEIIFRHLIQSTLEGIFGKWGIGIGSILYAGLFLGTLSLPAVLFWGVVGLAFGFWVNRTNSLWGVIFAHSLIILGGLIVYPLIFR